MCFNSIYFNLFFMYVLNLPKKDDFFCCFIAKDNLLNNSYEKKSEMLFFRYYWRKGSRIHAILCLLSVIERDAIIIAPFCLFYIIFFIHHFQILFGFECKFFLRFFELSKHATKTSSTVRVDTRPGDARPSQDGAQKRKQL